LTLLEQHEAGVGETVELVDLLLHAAEFLDFLRECRDLGTHLAQDILEGGLGIGGIVVIVVEVLLNVCTLHTLCLSRTRKAGLRREIGSNSGIRSLANQIFE
jgi:hypothetical protein